MSEPKINVATGFNGGVSVSLRADSAAEFEALLADAQSSPSLAGLLSLAGLKAPAVPDEAQAVANIQAAFPGSQVSTVGQPLPQPGHQQAQPAAQPPGVAYPGDCAHGPRVYTDKPAKGRRWVRWECSIPWSQNTAATRCKPINIEG